MKEFIEKHSARISGVLSGLDRVRFRGTFRHLAVAVLLERWLSHRRILMKNFKPFAAGITDRIQPYWSADETEYATDVMFNSSKALADLYPSLLRHSMTTFGSPQVLRFLGKTRIPKDGVDPRFNGEITTRLATPVISRGHRSRGLNPMSGIDAELVAILLKGEFCINGFRNRDLRDALFGPTADPAEHRRQSGRITRLLRLFVDHGLVYRVAKTHRYQLSAEGRRLLPSFATARAASTQKLADLAA